MGGMPAGKGHKEGSSSGKGKSKMGSVPPNVNFLDRPPMGVDSMSPHLDPHAPLSSGMHSLGSTMHMMQAPGRGPYDGMPPGMAKVPPNQNPGYPVNPKMAADQYMQHKPQPGMRM